MTENRELYWKSGAFGAGLGLVFRMIVGAITGWLNVRWEGVLFCMAVGGILGLLTGASTAAIMVWKKPEAARPEINHA